MLLGRALSLPRMTRKRPRSRLRTFLLGCSIGCGAVLAALLVLLGIVYYKVTAVPEDIAGRGSGGTAQPPPSSAVTPTPPTPSIDEQTQEIRRAAESGQQTQITLRIDEPQLNSLIAQEGRSSGPVRDLQVRLRDSDLVATGVTTWAGRQVYLTARLTPQASGGRLRLRVDSVRAGNLALPGSAVSRLQAEVDRGMARSPVVDERVYIDDAVVSNGEFVISGHTNPR